MSSNRPKAIYEPGTLDKTRANLGEMDDAEAMRMAKLLGGEVFVEKDRPIDYSAMPKRAYAKKSTAAKNAAIKTNIFLSQFSFSFILFFIKYFI